MFPVSKVTEIYCITYKFCKEFTLQQKKYMIEDKKTKHCNKPNRMGDAEFMVILILFHSSGFCCFKHCYKEYVWLCLKYFSLIRFLIIVLWNWRRKYCFPWPSSSKKYCWKPVVASVLSTPHLYVFVVTRESLFIRYLKDLPNVENVQWDGSFDSSYIW